MIDPSLISDAPTAWFLSSRAPTLLADRLTAAYEVPPRAMNRASRPM